MGNNSSAAVYEKNRVKPDENFDATLYYFAGRGIADQIRWMLAYSNISFTQKTITQKAQLIKLAERQLPFGQLPLLQIDGKELVQSQAIIRYIAKREHLCGLNLDEETACDMIAETIRGISQTYYTVYLDTSY